MKNIAFGIVLLLFSQGINAQNKKDLLVEVENLRAELAATKTSLTEARQNERTSLAKAEANENQALELQKINASLMTNLNTITEASAQRTDNIGRTLETLKTKEAQLKRITDQFSYNDSIALIVLTNLKKVLGEDANVGVENGTIATSLPANQLFGTSATSFTVDTNADITLGQIARVLNATSDAVITIETQNGGADNLDLSARQAAAIAQNLTSRHSVSPTRITAYGKNGSSTATIIRIHPKYDSFYFRVREDLKK